VVGSAIGQNLLQGTSSTVFQDTFGHSPLGAHVTVWEPGGTPFSEFSFSVTSEIASFGVLEATVQAGGIEGGWGNDILTGGAGFGAFMPINVSGATSSISTEGVPNFTLDCSDSGPGNTGDNFFPEGGNDIVNIAATEAGTLTLFSDIVDSSGTVLVSSGSPYAHYSTVFVGFYDVCNSGGPDYGNQDGFNFSLNSGVGTIFEQAITDINNPTLGDHSGEEIFADGYGASGFDANDPAHASSSPVVTVNGFHFGGPLLTTAPPIGGPNAGDTIVFGVSDWAQTVPGGTDDQIASSGGSLIDNPATGTDLQGRIYGLVQTDGETPIGSVASCPLELTTFTEADAANQTGLPVGDVLVVFPGITFANASDVMNKIGNSGGNIILPGSGVHAVSEVDMIIAYSSVDPISGKPDVVLADLTLTNTAGNNGQHNTDALFPVVHDLVHLLPAAGQPVNITAASLSAHNIFFVA
jgi:hypothetical protein